MHSIYLAVYSSLNSVIRINMHVNRKTVAILYEIKTYMKDMVLSDMALGSLRN